MEDVEKCELPEDEEKQQEKEHTHHRGNRCRSIAGGRAVCGTCDSEKQQVQEFHATLKRGQLSGSGRWFQRTGRIQRQQ